MQGFLRIRWPWGSIALLLIVLLFWPISHWWKPRVMLWWGTSRGLVGVTQGALDLVWSPAFDQRSFVRPYVTAWAESPQEAEGDLFAQQPVAQTEHRMLDWLLNEPTRRKAAAVDWAGLVVVHEDNSEGFEAPNQFEIPFTVVRIPLWHFGVIFATLAILLGWRAWRRRDLVAPRRCRKCGYDLRASVGRCPECGEEFATGLSAGKRRGWRRASARLRRDAVWISATLCVAAVALRPMGPPQVRVGSITDAEPLVDSKRPGASPTLMVFDVSDLRANDSERLSDSLDRPELKAHGEARVAWPYVVTTLDRKGRRLVIEKLNAIRRAR
jgi:hypothetical protein